MKQNLLRPGGKKYHQKILTIQPDSLYGWRLDEESGSSAALEVNGKLAASAVDILSNGGFETLGGGGGDVYALWSENAGDGAIANETTIIHGGSNACKITAGVNANTWVFHGSLAFIPGETATITVWVYGDGTNYGRYALYDDSNGGWIQSLTSIGINAAAWTEVTIEFTVPDGCFLGRLYLACPGVPGGIVYYDDAELTIQPVLNLAYASSGIAFEQPGIGDGKTSIALDGNNTYVLAGTKYFDTIWNGDKGSAIGWGKLAAAQWGTDTTYRYIFHAKSSNDATYYVVFGRSDAENQLTWRRRVGGDTNEQLYTFTSPPIGEWFCMGFAWDVSVPVLRGYLWSRTSGFVKAFDVEGDGIAWGVHPVDDGNNVFYAGSTSQQEWIGGGAHVYYWPGTVLTEVEFRRAMTPGCE
jgi:hypothetical protein